MTANWAANPAEQLLMENFIYEVMAPREKQLLQGELFMPVREIVKEFASTFGLGVNQVNLHVFQNEYIRIKLLRLPNQPPLALPPAGITSRWLCK